MLTRSPEYSMYSNSTFYALFIWYRFYRLYVDGDGQGRTSISRRPTFLVEGFEDTESFPAGLQYTLVRVNFVDLYRCDIDTVFPIVCLFKFFKELLMIDDKVLTICNAVNEINS